MPAALPLLGAPRVGRGPRRQSIRVKLTVAVIAAVLAAMVVVAMASALDVAQRHTRSRFEYLDATAAAFASAASRAVAADDRNGALLALRGVARAPDIIYARIERTDGESLAEIGAGVALASDLAVMDSENVSPFAALQSRTLRVTRPVVQGGVKVGRIVLVADNSDLPGLIRDALGRSLLATLLALAIAVFVAGRLRRQVTGPLLKLADAARHIARSHDYTAHVEPAGNDEIGDLCGGFNAMLGEIKERERRIVDLAMHDTETDLPNRAAFERELERRLQSGAAFTVAAVGVDHFQTIRAAVGYQLTNDLVAELGARLALAGAARLSTDVVGCIIETADIEIVRQLTGSIVLEAEEPILLGENTLDVSVSIGFAIAGVHADQPRLLVERANVALDQARAARAKVHAFDAAAYKDIASNVSLMGEMMRALHNGQMCIHFQPKYDIRERRVTGAEVLARWTHPTRGRVPPDLFIGMAEETGVIGVVTEWSLRQAIAAQMRFFAEGFAPAISVNLSGRLLADAQFIAIATRLLEEAPGQIYLEITETATIDNQDAALRNIAALKAAGARISLDDYGQGLSSLSYLRRLPADELKIDKTFIQLLGEQQRDALLVKSTIDLAHSLGLRVTAEGVETEAALAALTAMGCDVAQGYLIAKPMPESEFMRFLRELTPDAAIA
jgi:predicted signal transduction protein with EAL and GGDEF domain